MADHTPGPWRFRPVRGDYRIFSMARGSIIHVAVAPGMAAITLANARLIAAAPDLLAACRAVLAAWDDGLGAGAAGDARALCRAAIDKAEVKRG